MFGVLFVITDIVLGFVLHHQSSAMVQTLLRKNMLNLSNTAADLIDGDVVGAFTQKDVGSDSYNTFLANLTAFQSNADIEFIYAVRPAGEDEYVFILDADPMEPAAYGEKVVVTRALRMAGKGIAAVDDEPARDRWGNFYSSYSPVFDSHGNVAAIVGIDFNSAWYDEQIWKNTYHVIIISVLFTLAGILGFVLISIRVRRRFENLGEELATLSGDVEALTQEIMSSSGYKAAESGKDESDPSLHQSSTGEIEGDEILALANKITAMHKEMEQYLEYMHAQVNTDALTRVGNTTAYLERQKLIESAIRDQSADFSLVLFDINDLKYINDHFGHACGDQIIRAAANVIADCFGRNNTYRIGGDEFIAVVEGTSGQKLEERLGRIDQAVAAYNQEEHEHKAVLSLSKGEAGYRPGEDHSFHEVFVRADERMYERKDNYHRRNGRLSDRGRTD